MDCFILEEEVSIDFIKINNNNMKIDLILGEILSGMIPPQSPDYNYPSIDFVDFPNTIPAFSETNFSVIVNRINANKKIKSITLSIKIVPNNLLTGILSV